MLELKEDVGEWQVVVVAAAAPVATAAPAPFSVMGVNGLLGNCCRCSCCCCCRAVVGSVVGVAAAAEI